MIIKFVFFPLLVRLQPLRWGPVENASWEVLAYHVLVHFHQTQESYVCDISRTGEQVTRCPFAPEEWFPTRQSPLQELGKSERRLSIQRVTCLWTPIVVELPHEGFGGVEISPGGRTGCNDLPQPLLTDAIRPAAGELSRQGFFFASNDANLRHAASNIAFRWAAINAPSFSQTSEA